VDVDRSRVVVGFRLAGPIAALRNIVALDPNFPGALGLLKTTSTELIKYYWVCWRNRAVARGHLHDLERRCPICTLSGGSLDIEVFGRAVSRCCPRSSGGAGLPLRAVGRRGGARSPPPQRITADDASPSRAAVFCVTTDGLWFAAYRAPDPTIRLNGNAMSCERAARTICATSSGRKPKRIESQRRGNETSSRLRRYASVTSGVLSCWLPATAMVRARARHMPDGALQRRRDWYYSALWAMLFKIPVATLHRIAAEVLVVLGLACASAPRWRRADPFACCLLIPGVLLLSADLCHLNIGVRHPPSIPFTSLADQDTTGSALMVRSLSLMRREMMR